MHIMRHASIESWPCGAVCYCKYTVASARVA